MRTLLAILFLWGADLFAQVPGNFNGREIADVVFRDLDNAPNVHSAIYVGQIDKSGVPVTEPFYHEVIEMSGIQPQGIDIRGRVTNVDGIGFVNFGAFQRAHTAYYGAYMHPSYPGMEARKAILRKAQELMNQRPAIDYIVVSSDSALGLLTNYFEYHLYVF